MASQPLVSVVTPVHNGAKYIRECIESVLAQTYANFEFVVMENRSTDDTLEIVQEYAASDARIRVFAPDELLDPDPNANRAVRQIDGASRYVKIVHADDWLYPECLERMVALAETHPNVGVVSAYRLEEARVTLDGLPPSLNVVPGREVCRSTLLGRPWGFLFGSPTATLLRADLVRGRELLYPEDNSFQSDWEVCYQLLEQSDFGFVHQVLTFTRRHNEAESSRYWRAGAERAGQIRLLAKYGPVYLTPAEYERRLAVQLFHYCTYLTGRFPRLADQEFRSHQATDLRRMRADVDPGDVIRGVVRELAHLTAKRRNGTPRG
jgi:glycosyltransferase involved in cell wall biosynthesis